jgi:hypothetical protein
MYGNDQHRLEGDEHEHGGVVQALRGSRAIGQGVSEVMLWRERGAITSACRHVSDMPWSLIGLPAQFSQWMTLLAHFFTGHCFHGGCSMLTGQLLLV